MPDFTAIYDMLNNWPADGIPPSGYPLMVAKMLGFVQECTIEKLCRTCGTPRPDYTFYKITDAGRLFMAAYKHKG